MVGVEITEEKVGMEAIILMHTLGIPSHNSKMARQIFAALALTIALQNQKKSNRVAQIGFIFAAFVRLGGLLEGFCGRRLEIRNP
jgi:hypothetical protein